MLAWSKHKGMTLVEVLMAAAVVGMALLAMAGFIGSTVRSTSSERDRAFAVQKSLQMMEEMAAYKATGPTDKGIDKFASGAEFALTTTAGAVPYQSLSGNPQLNGRYKFVRKIDVTPVTGDPYARRVTVSVYYADKTGAQIIPSGRPPLAVITNVLHANAMTAGPEHVIDVYAISIENMPHVWRNGDNNQYYPSASDARRNFEAGLRDVTSADSNIQFRIHYITRLSKGRDPYYRPYINSANPLDIANGGTGTRDSLNSVYFYPGLIEQTTGNPSYYDATAIAGNIKIDSSNNGLYPECDQFNHAVQYAQEFDNSSNPFGKPVDPSNGTVVTGNPAIATTASMSLRQFLEDLLTAPTYKYRNAVVVNLNGEMFPMIPLRDYADAAKDPQDTNATTQKRRLVTHPYKLNFPAPLGATEKIRLMVYPYMSDGSKTPMKSGEPMTQIDSTAFPVYAQQGMITVPNLKPYLLDANLDGTINASDITIKTIRRQGHDNSPNHASEVSYGMFTEWPSGTGPNFQPGGPTIQGAGINTVSIASPTFGGTSGNDLIIHLNDLDYDARETASNGSSGTYYGIPDTGSGAPATPGGTGPDPHYLLHGLQYFPDPYLATLDQAQPATGGFRPRNTARVIIELQIDPTKVTAGQRFSVMTQLMKSDSSWPLATDPQTSTSYFYVKDALNGTGVYPNIPRTDQLQLVGDPRHNPYEDVRMNKLYNPYFSNFTHGQEVYKGLQEDNTDPTHFDDAINSEVSAVADVPAGPPVSYDVSFPGSADAWAKTKYNAPAYFRLWREALMRNNMVFVNVSGEPIRFLGLGGEFSLQHKVDEIGDLHISKQPYDGSNNNADGASEEFLNGGTIYIERANGDRWHCLPWIGEIYPADQSTTWTTTGNLPTAGTGGFRRIMLHALNWWDPLADNNDGNNQKLIDQDVGMASFLNAKPSGSSGPFDINPQANGNALVNTTGQSLENSIRLALNSSAKADYFYDLNGGNLPPEWNSTSATALRTISAWLDSAFSPSSYLDHSGQSDVSVSPILVTDLPVPTQQMIAVVDTARPTAASTVPGLLDTAMASLVGAFYDGTQGNGATAIKPLPRVKLTQPKAGASVSGTSLSLTWYAKWVRADGSQYSPLYTYNSGSQSPLPTVFFVKYKSQTTNGPYCTAKLAGGTTSACVSSATDPSCDAGNIPTAAGVNPITDAGYPNPNTISWVFVDPSGTALPNGDYLLRVEGYRKDSNGNLIPTNYAYHEIPVTIAN